MTHRLARPFTMGVLVVVLAATVACERLGSEGAVSGEVRFAREVALPEGAVVTVRLLDTTLADAPSVELGLDVIENAGRLPVGFRIEYDRDQVVSGNEYSLSADIRHGDDLLYVNDTVHPVLTRGAPANSDVVVVSTNPFDTCVEPLPGQIHVEMADEELPREAVLHVRLVDVTDPATPLLVTETTRDDLDGFPIEFSLPHEGVQISRHSRYELEAEIIAGDEVLYHIPGEEWRRTWLPHCPNADLQIVNSVFPASEFPEPGSTP
ncbi:MAG: YbaY family lipoprotein [bacterium]|nr:YbaY family lipoprotein [bacterium]